MTDEERRRLNKFGMGGDPNVLYGGEDDQGYAIPQVVAPVGEAEAKQPVLTDVKTATPTTQDETTDLADQYTAAVKQNEKDWQDYVLSVAERNRQQQEEMRQQERADRMAGTATGLTEMAANIANLITVGQGHATPQQYHNFSQDWMRKADQDMRERRHSNNNMQAQMERLNYQIQQVKNADRLSDIKLRIEAEKEREANAKKEEEAEAKRKLLEQDQMIDALSRGFVPDETEPTGFRFDPILARQIAEAKRAPKGGSSAGRTSSGQSAPAAASRSTSGNVGTTSAPSKPASPAAAPAASRDTTRIDTSSAAAQSSAQTGLSKEASEALARFFAAGGTPEMLESAETNGNGNRRSGRTTFLPPTEKAWNRGIDKKNSPQGRKKVSAPNKDEWSQYKI